MKENIQKRIDRSLIIVSLMHFKRTGYIPVYFIIHFEKFSFSDGKMAAAGLDLITGELGRCEEVCPKDPRTGGKSCFMRHLFVVDSLDKQMQNEKELIRLASARVRGLFLCVWGVLT